MSDSYLALLNRIIEDAKTTVINIQELEPGTPRYDAMMDRVYQMLCEAVEVVEHYDNTVPIRYNARKTREAWISEALKKRLSQSRLQVTSSLIDQAYEAETSSERLRLAQEAIKISPECAEAYLLIANEEADPLEAYSKYDMAERAALAELSPSRMQQLQGAFWDVFETRTYVRALCGKAECLFKQGKHAQSEKKYQEILALNTRDPIGIRYLLADILFIRGHVKSLKTILEGYPNDRSAAWAYYRAWVAKKTDSKNAEALKSAAIERNPYVIQLIHPYSTGSQKPHNWTIEIEKEAQDFLEDTIATWREDEVIFDWITKGA